MVQPLQLPRERNANIPPSNHQRPRRPARVRAAHRQPPILLLLLPRRPPQPKLPQPDHPRRGEAPAQHHRRVRLGHAAARPAGVMAEDAARAVAALPARRPAAARERAGRRGARRRPHRRLRRRPARRRRPHLRPGHPAVRRHERRAAGLGPLVGSNPSESSTDSNYGRRGPLLFSILLSLLLSLTAAGEQKEEVFTGVFALVWLGSLVVTVQIRLLGGKM